MTQPVSITIPVTSEGLVVCKGDSVVSVPPTIVLPKEPHLHDLYHVTFQGKTNLEIR